MTGLSRGGGGALFFLLVTGVLITDGLGTIGLGMVSFDLFESFKMEAPIALELLTGLAAFFVDVLQQRDQI